MLILNVTCYGNTMSFPLKEDVQELTAGSLPDNHIYLPYRGVSRRHFSIIRKEKNWFVKDLGSTNGTRLNGIKVQENTLKVGDKVQAGVVECTLQNSDDEMLMGPDSKEFQVPDTNRTDEIGTLSPGIEDSHYSFPGLVLPEGMVLGRSKRMLEVYQRLHSLAESDVSIMLIGETGAGKELFARTLHLSGKRSSGPFIAVNCAAIPTELAEAELFGIGEKVATDVKERKGKLVLANGGTLFLDELSAFPMALQAKILRALEERIVYPVGEHKGIPVNFRVISATNMEPQELISTQRLREDLYHRVAAVELQIPPVRERKEDLKAMVLGLLQQISKREGKPVAGISRQLFALLYTYSYPGNIRELINILSAMVAVAHRGEILDIHLAPAKLLEKRPENKEHDPTLRMDAPQDLHSQIDAYSRKLIIEALNLCQWNLSQTAKTLKVSPFGLRKMMKRLDIPFKSD
jgi:transcriptional regulator with PAS, ATPase and Fis domain